MLVSATLDFAAQALETYRRSPETASSPLDVSYDAAPPARNFRTSPLWLARSTRSSSAVPSPNPLALVRARGQPSSMTRRPLTLSTIPHDVLRRALGWVETFRGGERHSTLLYSALVCKLWNLTATEANWWDVDIKGSLDNLGVFVDALRESSSGDFCNRVPTSSLVRNIGIDVENTLETISLYFQVFSSTTLCPNLRHFKNHASGSQAPVVSLSAIAMIFKSCPHLVIFIFSSGVGYEPTGTEGFWKTDPIGKAIIGGVHGPKYLWFHSTSVDIDTAVNPTEASPNVDTHCPPRVIETVAAECHLLVSVDLSWCRSNVKGDIVQALLLSCPEIQKLDIFNTDATVVTIHALKSHRSLTLLKIGSDSEFFYSNGSTMIAEMALVELLTAHGSPLRHLCIGEPGWYPGALSAMSLSSFQISKIFTWSAHRMPGLRSLNIDDGDLNASAASIHPGVRLYSSEDGDNADNVSVDHDQRLKGWIL
ncbi:hypothetical protein BDK51DRAFT_44610 [Blyttiomyces helicus]|uniref:F-box domain-containing protein n=1 Tax=Blyttiomyces helicus TaxID=388810 RepID=A0A4P9WD19_9FUNG|nr:hypothetical protein BDK51DRAFT_44610 [Blyttiomyces helicus]|eukprot:RKO90232.1 hypothetical protein BDK51DRAFT_44610 [Blyttiomyces helicus]